jgi:hypothetical protein
MGIERHRTPAYFRKRAQQFRAKADNLEHEEARDSMVRLANYYEKLAELAEKIRAEKEQ